MSCVSRIRCWDRQPLWLPAAKGLSAAHQSWIRGLTWQQVKHVNKRANKRVAKRCQWAITGVAASGKKWPWRYVVSFKPKGHTRVFADEKAAISAYDQAVLRLNGRCRSAPSTILSACLFGDAELAYKLCRASRRDAFTNRFYTEQQITDLIEGPDVRDPGERSTTAYRCRAAMTRPWCPPLLDGAAYHDCLCIYLGRCRPCPIRIVLLRLQGQWSLWPRTR